MKKSHITWHEIELYFNEKLKKKDLIMPKDRYIEALIEEKNELDRYKVEDEIVYETELNILKHKLNNNEDLLKALNLIFKDDERIVELLNIIE